MGKRESGETEWWGGVKEPVLKEIVSHVEERALYIEHIWTIQALSKSLTVLTVMGWEQGKAETWGPFTKMENQVEKSE